MEKWEKIPSLLIFDEIRDVQSELYSINVLAGEEELKIKNLKIPFDFSIEAGFKEFVIFQNFKIVI